MADTYEELPDRLATGGFHLDYTVHLDSGGSVRIVAEADLLVTAQEELDFVYGLITALKNFEKQRGVNLDATG